MRKLIALLFLVCPLIAQIIVSGNGVTISGSGVIIGTASGVSQPCQIITQSPYAGGTVGLTYSMPMVVNNCTAPLTWSVVAGSLPASLSQNSVTGAITGTPSGTAQTYSFSVQAIDTNGQTSVQATTITIGVTCKITTSAYPNGTVGVAYSQSASTSGCTAPLTYSLSGGSLPSGLTITPSTGAISGTPTTAATSSFTVKAVDNAAQTATQNQSIVVIPPCQILTQNPAAGAVVGNAYSQAMTTGGCTAPLTWTVSVGSLPPSLAQNGTTGAITGTPTGTAQTYSFTTHVVDVNSLAASQATSIAVGNTCMVTTTTYPVGVVGQAYSKAATSSNCTAPIVWSISGGTLPSGLSINSGTGTISGTPSSASAQAITVKAIDNLGQNATQNVTVTINAACLIGTAPLPNGKVSQAYSVFLTSSGCTAPLTWSISSGTLPHLITLNTSLGKLSGTPDTIAVSTFTISVVDSSGTPQTASLSTSIIITAATGTIVSNSNCGAATNQTDGPAALPAAWLCSSEANTPMTTGTIVSVHAGGNLSTAYSGAACGSDIRLDAGVTYSMAGITLAAKGCDDSHWIWIRTVPSGAQPAEGTTTCPQFSNVNNLADYGIPSCDVPGVVTQSATAKISLSGPIAASGDHIRFENLEVVNDGTNHSGMSLFVFAGGNKIVVDRVWAHGAPGVQTNNAFDGSASGNISIVESYVNDSHCLNGATQQCSEGHGWFAGSGPGPFKVSHNFISAGGQHVFFGGGGPGSGAPQDIEITYNHGFKPCTWNPSGCRGVAYNGGIGGNFYVVKNNAEFKYANRVLIQGNIWENNWGGSTQVGNSITISPKNQSAGLNNLCPSCFTTNITERYDKTMYAGQGLQIFNSANSNGALAAAGNSYSIHDDVYSHLGYSGCFSCNAYQNELYSASGASATQLLHDVTINHVTMTLDTFAGSDALEVGGPSTGTLQSNLVWENSILPAGQFGIGSIGGQTNQCAFSPSASVPKFIACSTGAVFANAIPYGGGTSCAGHGCGGTWSGTGMLLAADQLSLGYTNFAADNFLITSGPLFNTALDGRTYGADIVTLNQQIANAP